MAGTKNTLGAAQRACGLRSTVSFMGIPDSKFQRMPAGNHQLRDHQQLRDAVCVVYEPTWLEKVSHSITLNDDERHGIELKLEPSRQEACLMHSSRLCSLSHLQDSCGCAHV
eukprot:1965181-Amphidinium_carterae.1